MAKSHNAIQAITTDLDGKQARGMLRLVIALLLYLLYIGFGEFLHDLYPRFTWQEHLQHLLILCEVHVQRNWWKAYPDAADRHYIMPLLTAESKEDYLQRIEQLCSQYPNRTTWFQGKKVDWVISGLVPSVSKVHRQWRMFAAKNTNIEESGHWQDYTATGLRASLISVILRYIIVICPSYGGPVINI
jgi:hypothetical protein